MIRAAGARYAPGLDATAPNLEILPLVQAFDAVGLSPGFRRRMSEVQEAFKKASDRAPRRLANRFRRLRNRPSELLKALSDLQTVTPSTARGVRLTIQRLIRRLQSVAYAEGAKIDEMQRAASDDKSRRAFDSENDEIRRFQNAISEVESLIEDQTLGLASQNLVLLTGAWGTGKTHTLCDLTEHRMRAGLPVLFALSHRLPFGVHPLQALCGSLASKPEQLLDGLQQLATAKKCRALLIVDAINEGDYSAWRRHWPDIVRRMRSRPRVALILSCRTPFDNHIFSQARRRAVVQLNHPGFDNIQFDAQASFFGHYRIPIPHVPLLTSEFSRPLFLRILCEALKNLSTAGQKKQFHDLASGQKGMTFLLEYFAKQVGAQIEREFRLPPKTCWNILKGSKIGGSAALVGLAPLMGKTLREYVTADEAIDVVKQFLPAPRLRTTAKKFLDRMAAEGLVAQDLRWKDGDYTDIVRLPYQRFSDHLVARHLLASSLDTASVTAIKRSFHKHKPLGRLFICTRSRYSYDHPGFASAVMVEFPERVRNVLPADDIELVFHLPRARTAVAPFRSLFLDGLHWRSASSFCDKTDKLVDNLLRRSNWGGQKDAIEVLIGLSTRPGHRYAQTLASYLWSLSMWERDLVWSEFIRTSEETGVIRRVVRWCEEHHETLSADAAAAAVDSLSLMLTTTDHTLRDRVTRCLVRIGRQHPHLLFRSAIRSLEFNDLYVPERMLAASYGVAMSCWTETIGPHIREALAPFTRQLVERLFRRHGKRPVLHDLMRDYATGIIELSDTLNPPPLTRQDRASVRRSSGKLSALPNPDLLTTAQRAATEPAIQMDFGNYTLGRLVRDRGNYQMEHPEYKRVRAQLLARMWELGYDSSRFNETDAEIGRYSWRQQEPNKTDRYGKKYSWIAFFELAGVRRAQRALPDYRLEHRLSDCGPDPSFPNCPPAWRPQLSPILRQAPKEPKGWLKCKMRPRYDHLLDRATVDGKKGGWVLLDGRIVQSDEATAREVTTWIDALFVAQKNVAGLIAEYDGVEFPGSNAIPSGGEDHYTFAGEIPWSRRFAIGLRGRDGKPKRNLQVAFERWSNGRRDPGIRVEVPTIGFGWESYHSALNDAGHPTVLAPALSSALGLERRGDSFDLYLANGQPAVLVRQISGPASRGELLYLRRSLLRRYLAQVGCQLVWFVSGERKFTVTSRKHEDDSLGEVFQTYVHVHKYSKRFE